MKFKVKSQLDHMEKGGILDDCGPSSAAAALSWAAGYVADFSAADGIAAKEKATGKKDVQGVADNGSSLADLAATVKVLGGSARYPKSWDDVVAAAKSGAGLVVWVQQAVAYPKVEISAWHSRFVKRHPKESYGHMTAAAWDAEEGWQWACPTRSGKGAEAFAVKVTEEELKQIADSKRASKKHVAPEFKHVLIVTHPARPKAEAPKPVVEAAKPAPQVAPKIDVEAPRKPVEAPKVQKAIKTPTELDKAVDALGKQDWGKIGAEGLALAGKAAEAAGKEKTFMGKIKSFFVYIADNSKIDEMLLDAVRTFLTVSISVALGLGIPLLDIQGGDFRTILSAGLASALQVIVKALDPNNSEYGVTKK